MTQKKIENIKTDYLNGMTYKDIFKKHNITLSDLKKIINQYKLTRNKSELYKGNQNAKNNKGGKGATSNNNNAVVTGEYEKIYKKIIISIVAIISSILLVFTYIPYAISFGYIFIALIIWILIKNKENILKNKLSNIIGIITIIISIIGVIIASFNLEGHAEIPARYYRNGISYLFNYLYNILLPFNDVQEKAVLGSFISIFPIPMIVSLYYLFSKEKHAEFLLPITIGVVFETIYCISGLPAVLENITLFSKTDISCVAPVVNFGNLLIIFYFLGNVKEKIVKFKNTIRISLAIVCILIFIERPIVFIANSYLYLFVAELCLLVFLFLYDDKKYRNVFLFFLCLLTLISGLTVSFM